MFEDGSWIIFNGFHDFGIKLLLFCFSGLSCGDVTWSAPAARQSIVWGERYATKYGLIFKEMYFNELNITETI